MNPGFSESTTKKKKLNKFKISSGWLKLLILTFIISIA